MEILVLLGVLNVLAVLAFVFWPKREPPDLDWKSCVKRREEEEKRRRELQKKAIEEDYDLKVFKEDETVDGLSLLSCDTFWVCNINHEDR